MSLCLCPRSAFQLMSSTDFVILLTNLSAYPPVFNFMNIKGTFYFDPSDRIYAEHFPGNPVVPGSLIIHAFLKALKENGINIIENFRFKEFISPGEYNFDIEICKDQMKCRLFRSSSDEIKPIVTGIIRKR